MPIVLYQTLFVMVSEKRIDVRLFVDENNVDIWS